MASWGSRNTPSYWGRRPTRSYSSSAGVGPWGRTMRQGTPLNRAMAHTPTAAPTASMSGVLWPITSTWEASATSSPMAEAITRLLTLVRRSASLDRPP